MDKIRLLLVDDQVLFVESLKTVLRTRAHDFTIVGIARNGGEAVRLVETEHPDVVLMDIRMPGINGVEATQAIRRRFPGVQIMVLTAFDDDEYVTEALRCGAEGYLLKDVPPAELIASIRAIRQGAVQMSPQVAAKLAGGASQEMAAGSRTAGASDAHAAVHALSRRERQVLSLLAKGCDNHEIAERLFLAEQTVKNHVSRVYAKLGLRDRAQAVRLAMEAGLGR